MKIFAEPKKATPGVYGIQVELVDFPQKAYRFFGIKKNSALFRNLVLLAECALIPRSDGYRFVVLIGLDQKVRILLIEHRNSHGYLSSQGICLVKFSLDRLNDLDYDGVKEYILCEMPTVCAKEAAVLINELLGFSSRT